MGTSAMGWEEEGSGCSAVFPLALPDEMRNGEHEGAKGTDRPGDNASRRELLKKVLHRKCE
jgi:hypothetical protein